MCSNEGKKVTCFNSARGPCFGGEGDYLRDINIHSDSNINKDNYCDFGHAYKHSDYLKGTAKAQNIFSWIFLFSNC
jgi:hypothetical protein